MILIGDSIYLFTKQRNDKQTTLYVLPNKAGNHAARKKTVFNAGGLITSAAFNPRNQTLLLLGYQENHYSPFIWKFTDFDNSDFFSGNKECRLLVNTPIRWQTEGITFINDDEVFISCETNKEYTASLYRIKLKNIFK